MEYSIDKQINALNIIKATCIEQNVCEDCPFANLAGSCLVNDVVPKYWDIKINNYKLLEEDRQSD